MQRKPPQHLVCSAETHLQIRRIASNHDIKIQELTEAILQEGLKHKDEIVKRLQLIKS